MDIRCAEKVVAAVQRERKRMVYLAIKGGADAPRLGKAMCLTRQRVWQLHREGNAIWMEEQADEAQD